MTDFPGITYDEYGRAYCAEHRRPECHVCGISFTMMNEEINENPSDRDVGVFLTDESLVDWHAKMKKRMPQVFPEDVQVFGDDPGQHPYGTKLLAHFDSDPNKPMPCTVVGSRWKTDDFGGLPGMSSPFADNREPMYVILIGGGLSQIGLMDAHMGDEGGWKAVGRVATVNARLDVLERVHQNDQAPHSDDEDSLSDGSVEEFCSDIEQSSFQTLNRHIRRTMKRLHDEDFSLEPWDQSAHGPFLVQFFMHSFSPSEREYIMKFGGHGECDIHNNVGIAERIRAFPVDLSSLQPDQRSFYARLVIAQMVVHCAHDRYGATILVNKRRTKFQAIEFNNFHQSSHLVPCINITYATDPEGIENPQQYLRGETIKIKEVSNDLAVVLEDHLLNCVSNKGLNDIGSGLLYHEGFLLPMEIIPNESYCIAVKNTNTSIPELNFGVELELSCASGNYQQRIASSIAKHAQVDVRTRGLYSKGGKWSGFHGKSGKGGGFHGKGRKGAGFMNQKGPSKESYRCRAKHDKWKLVYDESIQPNVHNPQSLMFEMVSPILSGASGLDVLSNTIVVMTDVACVRVNKSMGLHVHVEAKDHSLHSMKSICQYFLLYEFVMDSFFPNYRRTGSEKCHSYFESNLISVMLRHETLEGSLKAVSTCETRAGLYNLMNPGFRERYHKLNLQNLKTGRQPTIEFRQHHATKDEGEIIAWVRFCVLFVINAGKLPLMIDNVPEKATFERLFGSIIMCPVLQEYYSRKKTHYENRDS